MVDSRNATDERIELRMNTSCRRRASSEILPESKKSFSIRYPSLHNNAADWIYRTEKQSRNLMEDSSSVVSRGILFILTFIFFSRVKKAGENRFFYVWKDRDQTAGIIALRAVRCIKLFAGLRMGKSFIFFKNRVGYPAEKKVQSRQ
jgi:hypothetical protein